MRKTQLTIAKNFIFSIDNDEERVIHSKSDNIEIRINDEADRVIEGNNIKIIWNRRKVMSLSLIMFRHYIINVIK